MGPKKRLKTDQRALHGENSVHVCLPLTAHIPAQYWLALPHAPRHSDGSGSPRLRFPQGVPLLYRCCAGGLHTSQVHHTSHVTSLTSGTLVCCDPWWRRHAMTPQHMQVSHNNLYCFFQDAACNLVKQAVMTPCHLKF